MSTVRFARHGFIPGKIAVGCALMALAGSALSANLTLLISEKIITSLMLIVLPIVAFYVLKNRELGEGGSETTLSKEST